MHRGLWTPEQLNALKNIGPDANGRLWSRRFDDMAVKLGKSLPEFHRAIREESDERVLELYGILADGATPPADLLS